MYEPRVGERVLYGAYGGEKTLCEVVRVYKSKGVCFLITLQIRGAKKQISPGTSIRSHFGNIYPKLDPLFSDEDFKIGVRKNQYDPINVGQMVVFKSTLNGFYGVFRQGLCIDTGVFKGFPYLSVSITDPYLPDRPVPGMEKTHPGAIEKWRKFRAKNITIVMVRDAMSLGHPCVRASDILPTPPYTDEADILPGTRVAVPIGDTRHAGTVISKTAGTTHFIGVALVLDAPSPRIVRVSHRVLSPLITRSDEV